MRNAYEKLMVDPVGAVAVAALWNIITLECAGDQTIKPFDGMQNTRNGP
jgi:hypothetical protein